MSTEPQTQIPTQETQEEILQLEILKPVKEIERKTVLRHVYNTLRSFVESSSNLSYSWNHGVAIERNTMLFEKRPKWRLIIYRDSGFFKLYSRRGNLVMDVEKKMEYDKPVTYIINIYNGDSTLSFDAYDENELRFKAVTSDAPFARPIRVIEIIDRLCEFARFGFC
ncbi:hypothetical protein [Pyrobaculum sp.]|uniref:hypothetical protein n=1 Tax=Pyrobaculum sp. TaxID=2004705 RepID=UPI003D1456CC